MNCSRGLKGWHSCCWRLDLGLYRLSKASWGDPCSNTLSQSLEGGEINQNGRLATIQRTYSSSSENLLWDSVLVSFSCLGYEKMAMGESCATHSDCSEVVILRIPTSTTGSMVCSERSCVRRVVLGCDKGAEGWLVPTFVVTKTVASDGLRETIMVMALSVT